MKKLLSALFCLLLGVLLSVGLASCDESNTPNGDGTPPAACQHSDADGNSLCDKCGESYTDGTDSTPPAHTHTWGEWSVTTPATCQTKGVETRTCACGEKENRDIPIDPNAHTPAADWTTDVTNHWHDCTGCGYDMDKAAHSYNMEFTCACWHYKDEGVEFTLQGNIYAVTNYTGNATEVVIPSKYRGVAVTAIRLSAFSNCSNLISVTIPNSVTSIAPYAFSGCSSLMSITIPASVTSIGQNAFSGCTGIIEEENGVSYVDKWIIDCDPNVMSATLQPNTVGISDFAFSDCGSLNSITIPSSVAFIGGGAFEGCSGVIDEENGVSYVDRWAIDCDPNITSVVLRTNTVGISDGAFFDCDNLTSIMLSANLISIGNGAFAQYNKLESITVENGNPRYNSAGNCLIETASKTLILGCKNSIIPSDSSVTSIGDEAFEDCSGLTSIIIPETVTSIGESAFMECRSLTSITISEGVSSIGYAAFANCSGLTSITIPASVTSIGIAAFIECSGLTSITVESGNAVYHSAGNCLIETASKILNLGCKNSVIPTVGSITSIGMGAFYGCSGLTSITIPDSVTSIGDYAFSFCSGLTSITIPNSVTSIGYEAFSYCRGLTSITIPESVTSIGPYAFSGCSSLTSITIPNSVTSIGYAAFKGCSGLTSITIGNGVTSIGERAFDGCNGLTSITIPNSVTSIGYLTFGDCSGLTSISIPNSVTSIGLGAFSGCEGLISITIPDSVTSIGDLAFYDCNGLASITIPNSVTSIGYLTFGDCSGLTSIKYRGTEEQWNAITKGTDWDYRTGSYTITYNYTGE